MAEELQGLLDRIQKEGVEKAEAERDRILSAARDKAARMTDEAGQQAERIIQKAQKDADEFAARGRKALDQAARDVMLSLEDRIAAALRELVGREVAAALTPRTVSELLAAAVRNYCDHKGATGRLEALLNPEQQAAVRDHFMKHFADALREGVEIKGDENVISGFKIAVENDHVHHDFSGDALTDAVCELLRPDLAEIVRAAGK